MKSALCLSLCTKIISKLIRDPSVKLETLELAEEKVGSALPFENNVIESQFSSHTAQSCNVFGVYPQIDGNIMVLLQTLRLKHRSL